MGNIIDKIITNVNCKFGAPEGRCGVGGPPIDREIKVFDCVVPMDDSDRGYDKGGAYWGLGNPLRVLYTEDLSYIKFYRVEIDEFLKAYIACALWTGTDDNGNPMDENYGIDHIAPETMKKMKEDCKKFSDENLELWEKGGWSDKHAGHDFWLTRNGHGAGFWDRMLVQEIGDQLTEKCGAFGTYDLYIGDDNLIYGE